MPIVSPPHNWPEVAGIFVDGCVERGDGSRFRRRAHAHNGRKDRHFGWICVLSAKRLGTVAPMSGSPNALLVKPSRLLYHEYAHILTPNHGHDAAWVTALRRLGQPIERRYRDAIARARVRMRLLSCGHRQRERADTVGTCCNECGVLATVRAGR